MSQVRFLIDENLPLALVAALRRREPTLDVWRVGQNEMPAFGMGDSEIVVFCEQTGQLFLSLDRASVPGHVHRHIATGHHTFGVLLVTRRWTLRMLIED